MLDLINKERLSVYVQVTLLALAASVIYSAPYLRQLFKTSLLDAFSLTESQLGNLSSMYAITSIICYIPGGWIADRVAPRILVIIALFASAATYAWWATIPSYQEILIIHALWGVLGVGVLWAAMFKSSTYKDKPSINLIEPGVYHRFSIRGFPDNFLRSCSMAPKKTKRSARLSGRSIRLSCNAMVN